MIFDSIILLQEHMRQMYQQYYDTKATIIQKVWRGHYVRENVFSYYKLKAFKLSVLQANNRQLSITKAVSYTHLDVYKRQV